MPPALPDHILLDLEVLVDEVRPVMQVRMDTAHMGRRQHHRIRALGIEERLHGRPVQQVQFGMRPPHQVGIAPGFQIVPNRGAHQSPVARHIDFCCFIQHIFSFFASNRNYALAQR